MANMSRFQLIFTALLIFLGLAGILMFALSKSEGGKGAAQVVMWGTIDRAIVAAKPGRASGESAGRAARASLSAFLSAVSAVGLTYR